MVALLRYLLALYFAAMLGVAGLAKLERPDLFALLLHQQHILPTWCVRAVSRFLPWCEIALAATLVAGIAPLLVALLTLLLFVTFLMAQTLLLLRHRSRSCGCYGALAIERAAPANVTSALLLFCLAAAYVWWVGHIPAIGWHWRIAATVLFASFAGWIGWRVRQRRTRRSARRL
jgi:hypothetical protein